MQLNESPILMRKDIIMENIASIEADAERIKTLMRELNIYPKGIQSMLENDENKIFELYKNYGVMLPENIDYFQ